MRTFLASRESVSLSSAASAMSALLSFLAWAAVLFLPVLPTFPDDVLSVVADVGVGWFEPLSLSLLALANVVETGVGAAGVEVADAASVLSGCAKEVRIR